MRELALAILGAAIITAGLLVSGMSRGQTGQHGDGHTAGHDAYKEWKQPGTGASCCNDADCRPTRAYMGDDGLWRAWDGHRWLTVPADKVLPTDHAKDGRSHFCEMNGVVFCFSPGQVRG